jgi:rhodanese-related sulfurtransferase
MVDSVQALGKLPLRLDELPIDYAPCSGHKLFAPKGVGLLYVRDGAPFTPLLTGGGQEAGLRAGTENMAGIAALGAVLSAVEDGTGLQSWAGLTRHRHRLISALKAAFPDLELNAPVDTSLPTTLNFSVPGLSSRLLLNLFDAAGLRVSGGSACSASKAQPSYVLQAMGLPEWQTASAVRLSIDASADDALIDEACRRIRACGASLRDAPPPSAVSLQEPEAVESEVPVGMSPSELMKLVRARQPLVVVDVREAHEQAVGAPLISDASVRHQAVPLSSLSHELSKWLAQPDTSVVFFCRSGNRSAQAARALRRHGHPSAWSLDGGLALWPGTIAPSGVPVLPA